MQQKKILFFSRGRGWGHVIPDLYIIKELLKLADLKVVLCTYSDGMGALAASDVDFIDLKLPRENPYLETLCRAKGIIEEQRPDLVVSHEEFAVPAAAYMARVPNIFLSAWLPDIRHQAIWRESMECAKSLIVMSEPGLFATPYTKMRPICVGDFTRKTEFGLADRSRLRAEMSISDQALVVLVLPGGWGEQTTPLIPVVLPMFERYPVSDKRLIWVGRTDYDFVEAMSRTRKDIVPIRVVKPIDRIIAIADIVITKGTVGSTLDAASVGVPSLSISFGRNPMDDMIVSRYRFNTSLVGQAVTPEILGYHVSEALKISKPTGVIRDGPVVVAKAILQEMDRIKMSEGD